MSSVIAGRVTGGSPGLPRTVARGTGLVRRQARPGALRGFASVVAPPASLEGRSFLAIDDLEPSELAGLLDTSRSLRQALRDPSLGQRGSYRPLAGESIAMIFQKLSTRTRMSTETGMAMLGGHAAFLGQRDIQLGTNETLKDTARVLSRFSSLILARVYGHADVEELAAEASKPVINALSDLHHPLQALADLQTLQEHFGVHNLTGRTVAWVGDGNNVLHDLMLAAAMMGLNVNIATPAGYEPDAAVMARTEKLAKAAGTRVLTTTDPREAVAGAHAVVTDTWVSMGQEEDTALRLEHFAGYQVDDAMMKAADPEAVFLHCLPRHEYEVHDSVFYSDRALVWDEAENRMWTVMALMLGLTGRV